MGSPYGGAWYGALCKQAPLGRWVAYIYDLNRQDAAIWFHVFATAKEAKKALDYRARSLHGNPTNLKISRSAATPMPRAVAESLPQEGGACYPDSEYIFWQGGGERNTGGLYRPPEGIFMQGGAPSGLSAPDAPSGSTFLEFSTFGGRGEHHDAMSSYWQEEDASTLPRSSHSTSSKYWSG